MKVDFIIDGASVGAANGATYERRDPVTGKVASEAAAAERGRRRQSRRGGGARVPGLVGDRPEPAPRAAQQGGRSAGEPAPPNSPS